MSECFCEPESGITCSPCRYRDEIDRLRAEVSDALDILGLAGVDEPLSLADACRSRMADLAAAKEREAKLREALQRMLDLLGDDGGEDAAEASALLAEEPKP